MREDNTKSSTERTFLKEDLICTKIYKEILYSNSNSNINRVKF